MAIKDLAEQPAPSETWISVWYDDEAHEVYVQYGYVDISLPVEDFHALVETLRAAESQLEAPRPQGKRKRIGGR